MQFQKQQKFNVIARGKWTRGSTEHYLHLYEDASDNFHAISRHICINVILILAALILKLQFLFLHTYICTCTH